MSYTITAYTDDIYQEFALPAIDNADHSIVFSADVFGLMNDVSLLLEVIDGEWKILPSRYYSVRVNGTNYLEYPLTKDIALTLLVAGGSLSLVIRRTDQLLSAGTKYNISDISRVSFGTDKNCSVQYSELDLISGTHADIVKSGDGYILRDQSVKGTFLNNRRIKEPTPLQFGDIISIFGLKIIFLDKYISVIGNQNTGSERTTNLRPVINISSQSKNKSSSSERIVYEDESEYYHRPPRQILTLHSEPVTIDPPPDKRESEKKPLAMTIGPSFTMTIPMLLGSSFMIYSRSKTGYAGGAFMYVGLITAVTSAIIGIVWAIINIRYANKREREEELLRFEAYGDYLFECASEIKEKYEQNHSSLCQLYPSAEICSAYTAEQNSIWSRNKNHPDFLYHRVGIGNIPFQVPINIPKQGLKFKPDRLTLKPKIIKDSYSVLTEVPIGLDLSKQNLLGIVSDSNTGAMDILRVLVTQIAANNCYTEVKMVFLFDSDVCDPKDWDFARWLPHAWSEDHEIRYVASNEREKSDVLYEVTRVLRARSEVSPTEVKGLPLPHYVIFLSSASLIDDELISKYLLEPQESYGVSTVILADHIEELPNECVYIIENSNDGQRIYNTSNGNEIGADIVFDYIEPHSLDVFARSLCGVKVSELESTGSIPSSLTFFDMLHVHSPEELNVIERWRKNRTFDTMKACVGQKAGGTDCYIDIHEKHHGPHGLVAGTTGSGKSETLQTYILSLAVNYSPYDIAFFIIDYKGGGMANLFTDLPHLIGNISNLSGNQVRRSMVSIKSENKRRQKIFSEYGVNHINAYTKLLKNNEATEPIPHLFIIIDEFAELKREEPDFMRELISVTQVGRSLGVHLILSTQKPSGTVDDNIWSNSKMRLCLRVQDKQDSMDMLHKPDAVSIVNAGRCYLQVGNDELYELFQSGWSGATYDSDATSGKQSIATLIELTGRSVLTGGKVKKKQRENSKMQWLSSMIDCLLLATSNIGITVESTRNNAALLRKLAEETISVAEQYQLDYPESDYNIRRLEEFIAICPDDIESPDRNELIASLSHRATAEGKTLPERKEKTQLEATVEMLAQKAEEAGYDKKLQLWMPVLPEKLYLQDLRGFSVNVNRYNGTSWPSEDNIDAIEAMIGLVDDPVNQAQFPLTMEFVNGGHCAVCGTVSSGKSVLLQTMIYSLITRYTPDIINLYIADYSSHSLCCFENAPQVGGIVTDEDTDRVEKLFFMLNRELEERKKLLKGVSFSQYITLKNSRLPAMIVMIDGYANFREKTEDAFEENLIRLSREGIGYGIFLVISSGGFGGMDIQHRIADNIKTTICLEMGDKFKYGDVLHTMKFSVLPEANVKGRGLTVFSGTVLEYQTALCVEAQDDYNRIERITEICGNMERAWTGTRAKTIPFIPENPVWSQFVQLYEYAQSIADKKQLPFAYIKETASVCSIDLSQCYCFAVAGKSKSGKTDCIINMIRAASDKKGAITIIDTEGNAAIQKTAKDSGIDTVSSVTEIFGFWKKIMPTFIERNGQRRQLAEKGLSDPEIFEEMSKTEPYFIFITDMSKFLDCVYDHDKSEVGDMSSALENIFDKGFLENIYIIGGVNTEDAPRLITRKLYAEFIKDKYGILLGGNVAAQRVFSFTNIPYSEQGKSMKPGNGYISNIEDVSEAVKIVLPRSRG